MDESLRVMKYVASNMLLVDLVRCSTTPQQSTILNHIVGVILLVPIDGVADSYRVKYEKRRF